MTTIGSAEILARINLWAASLRERGQMDDATAQRLAETLAESRGERVDQQDDPLLVVMLCGPTAVGKSSLINALAGADISRPGLGATTHAAVLYVHEADDPARLFEYSHALANGELQEAQLIRHHRDELLHKVLVDTPDIDSIRLEHKELTARLVHAADLVLFVTSPEKYKVLRSARWILQQRQQRAIAFVLNKWDRQALGLQHERRRELEEDFRHVLANEGFADALIFKVSSLAKPFDPPDPDAIQNELVALRAWLETGLSQSAAAMIRQRRLRAAWGRLAAAIERAAPEPLSSHPFLPEATGRLISSGSTAAQRVSAEAALLEPAGLEDNGRPVTPGVLGMWTRTRQRFASAAASLRTGLSTFGRPARGGSDEAPLRLLPGNAFGERSVAVLAAAVRQLITESGAARLALGPVGALWTTEISGLETQLLLLPLDVAAELAAEADRATFRRVAGITSLYLVEGLIMLVLLIAIGRAGIDFVMGSYAPAGLFVTVVELVAALVVVGNIVANLFFPPLRRRLCRTVGRRATALVKAVIDRSRKALQDHVDAVDRLAQDGRELLRLIDRTVIALTVEGGDAQSVDRLFGTQRSDRDLTGQAPLQIAASRADSEIPARRRPRFD